MKLVLLCSMHHLPTFSDDRSFVNKLEDYVEGGGDNVLVENNEVNKYMYFLKLLSPSM